MRIFLLILFWFSFVLDLHAQVDDPKSIVENKEHEVNRLVIGGLDRSERLGKVVIEGDRWIEYDPQGELIATAEIKTFNKKKIKVKWITAKHGAEEGAVTLYLYSVLPNKILFNIKFDRKIRGFFEVMR
jgi:hypothetical protein